MYRENPIPELKRRAAEELVRAMDRWDQYEAASLLGTDQPRISELRRGRLERMSLERLIRWLNRADCDVELRVTRRPQVPQRRGRLHGSVARA